MGTGYYWRNKTEFLFAAQVHSTATDYFTHWVEAIPLCKINEDEVISFLQDHIMTRFGVPVSLVLYNAKYFSSIKLTSFAHDKGIKLHYSTNYYPQGNGLAESSKKI